MDKRMSLGTAYEELKRIHKDLGESEDALQKMVGESHVADLLIGDLIKQAGEAQRIVDLAGYESYEELLADYMKRE
jgi:hypothetical protein